MVMANFLVLLFWMFQATLVWQPTFSATTGKPNVRVVFLTDCTPYSDWQSIAMVFSYKYSGEDGPINRVMCCSEDERKKYREEMLELVETHVAPSYTVHPRTGDVYAAYNKPEAVIDWIEHVDPEQEWLVILDSDQTLRKPFRPEDFNITKGWASGARYDYLIGVNNELADRHIPEIPKRNDTLAGPSGRRSDKVGGFFFIHKVDLKRMSKLWLKYTEDVRADPEAWRLTGDVYSTKPGMKPWISEMYGYSFGAAKADVWHKWDEHSMIYPGYTPGGIPKVMHYGLKWDVEGYSFDKHWYTTFDPLKCPPWSYPSTRPQEGIFPEPPSITTLKSKTFVERYRDILAVEVVATLNAGLCDYHVTRCQPHQQMEELCPQQLRLFLEARKAATMAEEAWGCMDLHEQCAEWAKTGECINNKGFMESSCQAACGKCKKSTKHKDILPALSEVRVSDAELEEQMQKLGWTWILQKKTHAQALEGSGQQAGNIIRDAGKDAKAEPKDDADVAEVTATGKDKTAVTEDKAPSDSAGKEDAATDENNGGLASQGKDVEAKVEAPVLSPPAPRKKLFKQPAGHIRSSHLITAAEGDEAPKVSATDVHELTKRCTKMGSLTMAQVRECMAAAKKGERWTLAPAIKAGKKAHRSEEDLNIDAEKVQADGVLADGEDVEGGARGVSADQLGLDESSLTQPLTSSTLVVAPSIHSSLLHVGGWQGLAIWLAVVGVFLLTTSRLWKRARKRSGMRSE